MLRIMQPLIRSSMVSLAPLRGEIRGYFVNAVARLRLPGSRPAPMWQEAQASRLSMCRILASATSGPIYSEVCEMSRRPYSSVVEVAEGDAPGPLEVRETLPKAMVAATEIAPTVIHTATTIPIPRGEAVGLAGGVIWGSWVAARVSRSAPHHSFSHLPESDTWAAPPTRGGAATPAMRRKTRPRTERRARR